MPRGIAKNPKKKARKLRKANLGKIGYWRGKKRPDISAGQWGKDNHSWKGDKVGYTALHQWLYKQVGQPKKCQHCRRVDLKQYYWANKNHTYKRNIKDWIRLCPSCHIKYDLLNNNRPDNYHLNSG